MRDAMMSEPAPPDASRLEDHARKAGLDTAKFSACLEDKRHEMTIQDDIRAARSAGITGTPTFVAGLTKGNTVTGSVIVGAQPYASFEAVIKSILAESP